MACFLHCSAEVEVTESCPRRDSNYDLPAIALASPAIALASPARVQRASFCVARKGALQGQAGSGEAGGAERTKFLCQFMNIKPLTRLVRA